MLCNKSSKTGKCTSLSWTIKRLSQSHLFIFLFSPFLVGLASEGVSSGYESMRYESSNNLNTVSDLDSERGKTKSLKRDKKGRFSCSLISVLSFLIWEKANTICKANENYCCSLDFDISLLSQKLVQIL